MSTNGILFVVWLGIPSLLYYGGVRLCECVCVRGPGRRAAAAATTAETDIPSQPLTSPAPPRRPTQTIDAANTHQFIQLFSSLMEFLHKRSLSLSHTYTRARAYAQLHRVYRERR